jgi:type III restriction enzyme
MHKNLKYQKVAVDELIEKSNKLLKHPFPETLVFKAPTGSGKTIMVAQFLERFVNERTDGKTFSFIWAAPRKLHNQSKEKLERQYEESRILQCSNIEDLNDKQIQENEILFLNWESINKKDNVFIRENEQDFNLSSIVDNTLDAGREIILIIDESHHTASAENTSGLIEIMKPRLTLEVSATPHMDAQSVNVDFADVIEEGMIKKEISVNPSLVAEKLEGKGSDEFILENALKKRKSLKHLFERIGKDINPLLLIQLPDRTAIDFSDKQTEIEELLAKKFNITTDNGKLGVYLSEDKRNLENISKQNNEVEVLIFKQAIALGWDCPRAYILVLFREWHSEVFSIQTVGRIIRMPELKHYDKNEDLNKAYVYTNVSNNRIQIEEDASKGFFTIYSSARIPSYKPIDLLSCHSKRQRELTRLNPSFIQIYLKEARKQNLKSKLDTKTFSIIDSIPLDGKIHLERVGVVSDVVDIYNNLSLAKNLKELEDAFKYFISATIHTAGLFPEPRSVGRVCKALYEYFVQDIGLDFVDKQREINAIVLLQSNRQAIVDSISASIMEYQKTHPKGKNELEFDGNWNIPETREYNAHYKEHKPKSKSSVLQPYYETTLQNKQFETERQFIQYLDEDSKKVEWWFKNGEGHGSFFAVSYTDNDGEDRPFYIDFIVKMKDGRIGLFDTKSGITAEIAGSKSNGLQKYIKDQNKKGKKLFGGIVIPESGSFWLFDKLPYQYDEKLTGWNILEI